MLSFMRSAPPRPLIRDQAEIDATYRHWRLHLLLTMYLGYAVFYFTRKSFNFAMPDMLASGMLDKSDIGMLWTLFYITYGCSKFFSGIISDRANPRYFMGVGLMATGVINILFGLSSALWMFAALWVANAFFQGWGWPPAPSCSPAGIRAPSAGSGGRPGTLPTTSAARSSPLSSAPSLCNMAGATA